MERFLSKLYTIINHKTLPQKSRKIEEDVFWETVYRWAVVTSKFHISFFDKYHIRTYQEEIDRAIDRYKEVNGDFDLIDRNEYMPLCGSYDWMFDKIFESTGIYNCQNCRDGIEMWWIPKERQDVVEWLNSNLPRKHWTITRSFIPWAIRKKWGKE